MIQRRRDKGTSAFFFLTAQPGTSRTPGFGVGKKGEKISGTEVHLVTPPPPPFHYGAWSQANRGFPARPSRVLLMYYDSKEK